MTDYLALAREALQHEGISTYFGNMGVHAYRAGAVSAVDLARILASELDGISIPADMAWSAPDWVTQSCTVALFSLIWSDDSSVAAIATGLGVEDDDVEALGYKGTLTMSQVIRLADTLADIERTP